MGCNRCRNINRNGQVMGEFGTTRIALRGPGCINGTGRCNVAGASGRCTNVFGTGDDLDRCESNVLGTGGNRKVNNNVAGTGGRNRYCYCDYCCECLETPITVPR